MQPNIEKTLRPFTAHGVYLSGESGDQVYGTCPFTGKEDKFYINVNNLLWDSKTAGLSGNLSKFLELRAADYEQAMTEDRLAALAEDRQLPLAAFRGWHIGWTGRAYAIPIRDVKDRVVDIRLYRLGGAIKSTPGAKTGILGIERIASHSHYPIYLCEGEWDTIALNWLRTQNHVDAFMVGVPGAGVFKPAWVPWFHERMVHVVFDKDQPGEEGEQKIYTRLKSTARSLTFTHWPDDLPNGFDARDWTVRAITIKKTKTAWRSLHSMFQPTPRAPIPSSEDSMGASGPEGMTEPRQIESRWTDRAPTLREVQDTFKKWLHLESTDAISIMLASAVSQFIDGEPIWMFLVGPPGSAKTETLNSLSLVPQCYMTSTLTPHSLISGANWKDGGDPSLIPRLDGKIMVIKDFTSILSLRDTEKEEIFGILRDAFDGKCGKEFGNGIVRRYESRFTIVAAVTPSIYSLSSQHTALGERFLKFGVADNLVHRDEEAIIRKAITNINQETEMRNELADVVYSFLDKRIGLTPIPSTTLPTIGETIENQVINLARFGARMRGTVTRDTYRNDIITSRPSAEIGSRLGKQLAKLCQSLAVVHGRRTVTMEEYRLVKKVMLDTIPQRTEDVLRHMLRGCAETDHVMTLQQVAQATRYPPMTVSRILQDLNVLEIVSRAQIKKGKFLWTLTPHIRTLVERSGLYSTEEERNRPSPFRIRTVKRRKKRKSSSTQPSGKLPRLRLVSSSGSSGRSSLS